MTRNHLPSTTERTNHVVVDDCEKVATPVHEPPEPVDDTSSERTNSHTHSNSTSTSNDDGSKHEIVIPEQFICPLTLEVYKDPLMSRKGLSFEREAITEWLDRGNDTCPLTRTPLGYRGLVPNTRLRLAVEDWKRRHGYELELELECRPHGSKWEWEWEWECECDYEYERKRKLPLLVLAGSEIPAPLFYSDPDGEADVEVAVEADRQRSPSLSSRDPEPYPRRRRRRNLRRRSGATATTTTATARSTTRRRPNLISILGEALSTVRHGSIVDN